MADTHTSGPWHVVVHGKWRPERFGPVPAHTMCGAPVPTRGRIDRAAARHIIAHSPCLATSLCAACRAKLEGK